MNPVIKVGVGGSDFDRYHDAKEGLQISDTATSCNNGQKELVVSVGQFPSARPVGASVRSHARCGSYVTGAHEPVEVIAKLFVELSLSSLAMEWHRETERRWISLCDVHRQDPQS